MKHFYEGGNALPFSEQRRTFSIQRNLKNYLYSFKCLLLSLSAYCYQFSCNVQESRASGTTGYAARLIAALAHAIKVLRTVYTHKRSNVGTCLTHVSHMNDTCLTHEPHMNDTTNCGKEVGIGNQQAGSKLSRSMASVLRFNTLLIHCYYFTHTWLILRPYTKSASTRVASWLGIASRLGRTLVHTCSTVVRVLFECCSSATRTTLEAHPKSTRSRVEEVSNTTRSRVEGQSKDCRSALEGLSNRLSRFTCNDGKVVNDLCVDRLILRWFHSFCKEVRGEVGSIFIGNKRSSQNSLNEVDSFLTGSKLSQCKFSIFGTGGPKRVDDIKKPMVYGLQLIAIFCVLFSFASVVEAQAQEPREGGATGQTAIKPLEIGGTIPEELWHLPLQVVNHPEGKETITLNDYRGKGLIMLDFMSTGCSGCVKALPAMEKVAGGFDGEVVVLPVTHEQADRMRSFRKHNHLLKDSELTYVVEDSMLKKYFPHQYISHLVWIDKDGVIKAFTNTSQVRDFTVTDFLNGRAGDWVVKTETTDFFNDQLVMLNPKAETLIHNVDAPLAYAAFSGFLEGVGPYYQTEIDTLRGVERVSLRNISLFEFGLISLGLGIFNRGLIFHQQSENWQVERPERYAYELADANLTTRSAWEQQHAICYERTFPLGLSKEEKYKYFRQDLENLLGIKVDQEEKNDTIQLMFTETANYK